MRQLGSNTYTYAYNGLGDRLQQTVNGQTTNYTLDLNAGLTQVLDDGTNTYTYGVDRISQQHGTTAEYYLDDALGSVRQMTDASDAVTLSESYDPYGNVISRVRSSGTSVFGYTGEQADSYIKLINLRSRLYDPAIGRFTTKDLWQGDYNNPQSLDRWNYVEGNPINRIDPTGHITECTPFERSDITQWLMDELNADKDSWITQLVKNYMEMPKDNQKIPLYSRFDPALVGSLIFADAVQSGGLWDFKLKIHDYIGEDIRINDKWYYYDVSGNITFGYLGLAAGISESDLHCGADAANDKSVLGYCSGHDPAEDYDAIEAGFDLWKVTKGRTITLPDLSLALQTHPMHGGKPVPPRFPSINYWPYKVGTFDGTKSWFVHR